VDDVTVIKEDALNKLKPFVRLTPIYYDDVQKHYFYLYGKLDCNLGVNAYLGEVINLGE